MKILLSFLRFIKKNKPYPVDNQLFRALLRSIKCPPGKPILRRGHAGGDAAGRRPYWRGRMANSEAVAHTPQPHIGEAYVGIKCSISTMYRGAVPITEHQPADVLEPLRGTGWGVSGPHKGTTLRPLRLPCASCHCGAGGYAKPLRGSRYIHFCWRNGCIPTII